MRTNEIYKCESLKGAKDTICRQHLKYDNKESFMDEIFFIRI